MIEATRTGAATAPEWLTARPIAHRGLHDGNVSVYENSLPSFEAAIRHGYAIECDVHPTREGDIVVFHDDKLERLTGREGSIRELSRPDIEALSLRSSDAIPMLGDMLGLVAGRVPIVFEMKGFGDFQGGFARELGSRLAKYDGPAAAMSFDQGLLADFPPGSVPLGLTAEGTREEDLAKHEVVADRVSFLSYKVDDLPNAFVRGFRSSGRPVLTWTVRTPEQVALTEEHADQMTFEGFLPVAE